MRNWDYDLPKHWQPDSDSEWVWYIERVVNYGAGRYEKLDKAVIKKYFNRLRLDNERKEYLRFLVYES